MSKKDLIREWSRLQTEVYQGMTPTELKTAYNNWFGEEPVEHRKDMVIELMESEEQYKVNFSEEELSDLVSDLKFHLDYD